MRKFTILPAILVLVAMVVGCTDTLTAPKLSDGPLLHGKAPPCIHATPGEGVTFECGEGEPEGGTDAPPAVYVDGTAKNGG